MNTLNHKETYVAENPFKIQVLLLFLGISSIIIAIILSDV